MLHNVDKTVAKRCLNSILGLALSAFVCTVQAQQAGTYRVINVRVGSALNVRAEHNSGSMDIGSASPGTPLEVVDFSANGSWAKVRWEGSHGWVSMRFLSREGSSEADVAALAALQRKQKQVQFEPRQLTAKPPETQSIPEQATTAALYQVEGDIPSISCVGRGPNWVLTLSKFGALMFQAPDDNSLYATARWRQASDDKSTYAFAVSDIKGTLLRKKCLDKRSNQHFDWQLNLQTNGFGGQDNLSGCCSGD